MLSKHLGAQDNQHFQTPPKTSEASDQHFHTPFETSEPKWKTKPKLTATFNNRSRGNRASAADILEASKSSRSSQDSQHNSSQDDDHNSNDLDLAKYEEDVNADCSEYFSDANRSQQAHNANQSSKSNCSRSSNAAI